MHKPIDIRPLRTLTKDGINDVGIDMTFIVGHSQVNQVVGFLRNGFIMHQLLQGSDVILDFNKLDVALTEFAGLVKDPHAEEKKGSDHDSEPTAMAKLKQVGNKEGPLDAKKHNGDAPYNCPRPTM